MRGGVADLPVGEGVEYGDVDWRCVHDSILSYRQETVNYDQGGPAVSRMVDVWDGHRMGECAS
jgi:hypothetical protein